MNREDIIRMAGHREVPPWVMKLVQDCVDAEREACYAIVYGQCGSDNVAQRTVDVIHGWTEDGRRIMKTIPFVMSMEYEYRKEPTKENENESNC